MTPYQSSTNPRLCSVDKHILVVVCRRRWWRLWDSVSYLRCLFCDLNLGPLPGEISSSRPFAHE